MRFARRFQHEAFTSSRSPDRPELPIWLTKAGQVSKKRSHRQSVFPRAGSAAKSAQLRR